MTTSFPSLHNRQPFKILSIDGGGLKGIAAISILKWIEEEITHKSIVDSFDLFAGSSTGGLIACALTICKDDNKDAAKYTAKYIRDTYLDNADKIFPYPNNIIKKSYSNFQNLISPRFSGIGLLKVFETILGNKRLNDCIKPIFIPSYDINSSSPVYFTNRRANPLSENYSQNAKSNLKLIDICRATSAAPMYLSSHNFVNVNDLDEEHNVNCIDGGIFLNNPSIAAYAEVLSHSNDPFYTKDKNKERQIISEDVYILSIGTGRSNKNNFPRKSNSWGIIKWIKPLVRVMMEGNSQSVDHQMKNINKNRYVRINIDISEEYSDMTDSRPETLKYLINQVKDQIADNKSWIHKLTSFKNFAKL